MRPTIHDTARGRFRSQNPPPGPGSAAYDVPMVDQQHIAIEALLADPGAVLDMVEREHVTLTVMREDTPVAVVSPAPVAQRLQEIHRALEEGSRDDSFYLDVMDTRRLLGL